MAIIYGLFDPRESLDLENCHYIGKTIQTAKDRRDDHIEDTRYGLQRDVHKWIRSIKEEGGVDPVIIVIAEIDDGDKTGLSAAERFWIAKGREEGWPLTNHQPGGDGQTPGFRFSDEQRQRLSEIVRQQHIDHPEIAEHKRQGQIRRYSDPKERELTSRKLVAAIAASDKSDKWCPDCGKGPFAGTWGIASHRKYDHNPQPQMCPDCGAGPFQGRSGVTAHQQHKHQTVKEPLMCECGKGPFDGNHGLGIHKGRFCVNR